MAPSEATTITTPLLSKEWQKLLCEHSDKTNKFLYLWPDIWFYSDTATHHIMQLGPRILLAKMDIKIPACTPGRQPPTGNGME